MNIACITNVPESVGHVTLVNEAKKRGHTLTTISWRNAFLYPGFAEKIADSLAEYDLVHIAAGLGRPASKEVQTILEQRGIYCLNSFTRRSLFSDNKIYQAIVFAKHNLPAPKSARATIPDYAELGKEIGWPLVAKEPGSSKGNGVHLLHSEADAGTLDSEKEYLFQEYIEYAGDYRVHVIGGKPFCLYRRIPTNGEFRANVSLGGSMEKVPTGALQEAIYALAIRAVEAMNLDFGAADIIQDKKGNLFVLEVNSDPGFKDVVEITGESFAEPIIDFYETHGGRTSDL